jgi:phage terminase small subunit
MKGKQPCVRLSGGELTEPNGLGEAGIAMWRCVTGERGPWLAAADAPALQLLCEVWEMRLAARDCLRRNPIDKDSRIAFCEYQKAVERLLAKFGMTPTDRERLTERLEDDDPAAEFVA